MSDICLNDYEIVEVKPEDLQRCSSFWYVDDSRLVERKAFAYKVGDEFVGGCALFVRYEKCGHFSHFFVRSDLRGKGIGSRILDFAIQYFKNIGMEKMRLHVYKDNPDAIRLYKRYGFEQIEETASGKIIMIKQL